jgi:hypothetical protein
VLELFRWDYEVCKIEEHVRVRSYSHPISKGIPQ